jgi:hypothetical protein
MGQNTEGSQIKGDQGYRFTIVRTRPDKRPSVCLPSTIYVSLSFSSEETLALPQNANATNRGKAAEAAMAHLFD